MSYLQLSFFHAEIKKWEANKDTLQHLTTRISRLTANLQPLEATSQGAGSAEKKRREELERQVKFSRTQFTKITLSSTESSRRLLKILMILRMGIEY